MLPADAGAASAASSTAGQLGSSLGVALLNTIAASATAVFLASHTAASLASATVHGYTVAMRLGGGNSADRHGARRSSRQGQDAHSHGLTRQAGLRPTWGELCAFKAYNSPQVGEGPSRGRPKPGMAHAGKARAGKRPSREAQMGRADSEGPSGRGRP